MIKKLLVVVSVAVTAVLSASAETPYFKTAPSRKIRVVCIGDSITWGCAMTNRVRQLAK